MDLEMCLTHDTDDFAISAKKLPTVSTYSALLSRLAPETVQQLVLDQLDRAGLGHNTFTPEAPSYFAKIA